MKTIDEEIKYSRKRAQENRKMISDNCEDGWYKNIYELCAGEFDQIADWLEELKVLRKKNNYNKAIDDFMDRLSTISIVNYNNCKEIAEELKINL